MTDAHRQWIEERYRDGWEEGYSDEQVKFFREKDFAYHKVKVVFWQTDEHGQPLIVTEPYKKKFTAQNINKEQEFYASDLEFSIRLTVPEGGRSEAVSFKLTPEDSFAKVYEKLVREIFAEEIEALTKGPKAAKDKNKMVKQFVESLEVEAEWTHRDYVKDDEYITYGEDIECFLVREIAKPIIRWKDSPQLGYEFMPNKYFYRYQPPTPAKNLLEKFWQLEEDAEKLLRGQAVSAK